MAGRCHSKQEYRCTVTHFHLGLPFSARLSFLFVCNAATIQVYPVIHLYVSQNWTARVEISMMLFDQKLQISSLNRENSSDAALGDVRLE